MIYRKQLIRHDPANGFWGDCTRTALACMLNLEPGQVPHFCDKSTGPDGGDTWKQFKEWLVQNAGVQMVDFIFDLDPADLLKWAEAMNPGVYWMMGCRSKIANHSVVCCGGEVVCDPGLGDCKPEELRRSSDGWTWMSVLVPVSQVRLP